MADRYDAAFSYSTTVSTKYWSAPELIVGYRYYDLSSDMWAYGAMLAALVFDSEPFFYGSKTDANQLLDIVKTLGTEALFAWLDKYEITLDEEFDGIKGWFYPTGFESHAAWRGRRDRLSAEAIDLLNKICVIDHQVSFIHGQMRITLNYATETFDRNRSYAASIFRPSTRRCLLVCHMMDSWCHRDLYN
jgi:casein kinase II subunit alpha